MSNSNFNYNNSYMGSNVNSSNGPARASQEQLQQMAQQQNQQAQQIDQNKALGERLSKSLEKADARMDNLSNNVGDIVHSKAVASTNAVSSTYDKVNLGQDGYYNGRAKYDMTDIANAAVETAKSAYNETDAVQGKNYLKAKASVFGTDILRSATNSKVAIEGYFDNNSKRFKLDDDELKVFQGISQYNGLTGKTEFVGGIQGYSLNSDHRLTYSHNAIGAFNANKQAVERELAKFNINAKNLSASEVKRALDSRVISGSMHKGKDIEIDKVSDPTKLNALLKEWGNIKSYENKFNNFQKGKGGLKSTVRAWGKEAFGETDAAKGFQSAKTIEKSVKVSYKAGRAIAGFGGATAVSVVSVIPNAIGKARAHSIQKLEKARAFAVANHGYMGINNSSRIQVLDGKIAKKLQAGNPVKELGLDQGKNFFVNLGKGNYSVRNLLKRFKTFAYNKTIGKTFLAKELKRMMAQLKEIKAQLLKTTVGKIFSAPFKFFNMLKEVKKKLLLAAGGFLLLIVLMSALGATILSMAGFLFPTAVEDADDPRESTTQHSVDGMWLRHRGYLQNSYFFDINSELTQEMFNADCEHLLPEKWQLKIGGDREDPYSPYRMPDCAYINNWDGTENIFGYDMHHYWGPADIGYTCQYVIQDAEYDPYTGVEVPVDKIKTSTIYSCAGVAGDAGVFEPGDWIVTDEGTIRNIVTRNEEIGLIVKYKGSDYSFEWTEEKNELKYITSDNVEVKYGIDSIYRAIISCATWITQNSDDLNELEFYENYCYYMFDRMMGNADVEVKYQIEAAEDPSKILTWTVLDDSAYGTHEYQCMATGYKREVTVVIEINDIGFADIIELDDVDNDKAIELGSLQYAYAEYYSDTDIEDYIDNYDGDGEDYQPPVFEHTNIWEGWFSNGEPNDFYELALMYYELDIEEFEEDFFPGIVWPGGTGMFFGSVFDAPGFWSDYVITDNYGWRISPITGETQFHAGVDIAGLPAGTPIGSFCDGVVVAVGSQLRTDYGAGNYVMIQDSNGVTHCYFHMQSPSPLSVGSEVKYGDYIGDIGTTGASTGPHLHYELRAEGGGTIDPHQYSGIPYVENGWIHNESAGGGE